jgi:hypothetical protein
MKKIILIISITLLSFSCIPYNGSKPGDPPAVPSNVVASKLEFTDKIKVTWDEVTEADAYKVYRYAQYGSTEPEEVMRCEVNYIYDESASTDTPHYYRVASVGNDAESGQSANYVLGIAGSVYELTDINEPNDKNMPPKVIAKGLIYDASIYTFQNGVAQDEDYYVYDDIDMISGIRVTLPDDTPFTGPLYSLQIKIDGSLHTLVPGQNNFSYAVTNVVLRIDFENPSPELDKIGTYTIELY